MKILFLTGLMCSGKTTLAEKLLNVKRNKIKVKEFNGERIEYFINDRFILLGTGRGTCDNWNSFLDSYFVGNKVSYSKFEAALDLVSEIAGNRYIIFDHTPRNNRKSERIELFCSLLEESIEIVVLENVYTIEQSIKKSTKFRDCKRATSPITIKAQANDVMVWKEYMDMEYTFKMKVHQNVNKYYTTTQVKDILYGFI